MFCNNIYSSFCIAEPLTLPKRNEDWESAEEEEDQLITPKASRIRKGTSLSETSNRSSKKVTFDSIIL